MSTRQNKLIVLFLLFWIPVFFVCQKASEKRKIKLSEQASTINSDDQLTTTIYLEPKERRSIAVMFFQNLTGDKNLEWLQKGLTEMFIRSLSQSQSLSIVSSDRLLEILNRSGKKDSPQNINMDLAAVVAKEANVEAILVGNISKNGEAIRIEVKLKEANQGKIFKQESIEGPGLEKIFSMVDEISQKIRQDLQLTFDTNENQIPLSKLTNNSLEAWRHYANGIDYVSQFLYRDAIKEFKKAVELDSMFVSAYLRLRFSLLQERRVEESEVLRAKLNKLKNYATEREKFEIELIDAQLTGNVQKQIMFQGEWLKVHPDDVETLFSIAVLYYNLNNHHLSIEYLENLLKIAPNYKLALNQLGYEYAFVGDLNNAIKTFQRYAEIAPNEPNPFDSMGEIYFWQGDFDRAEKYYRRALEVNPDFIASWDHLADVYLEKGEYKKALKIFNQYSERTTGGTLKALVYSNMANAYLRLNNLNEAIKYLKKSVTEQPFQYYSTKQIHDLYLHQKDSTAAQQILEESYHNIFKSIDVNTITGNYFNYLANFALWHGIHIEEITELLETMRMQTKNTALKLRIEFVLSLIYIKYRHDQKLAGLLSGSKVSDIIEYYKEVRSFNFTNMWKYYLILNQNFNQNLEAGIQYYKNAVQVASANGAKHLEVGYRLQLADLYQQNGDEEKFQLQYKFVGMAEEQKWLVIGPFDNTDGFRKEFSPEKSIDLKKYYNGKKQKVAWTSLHDNQQDGFVNLGEIFQDLKWTVGYGFINLKSPSKRDVQFRIGIGETGKIWLNDDLVWQLNYRHPATIDDRIINVSLKAGLNKILIKVCSREADSGFYFRITDDKGDGFPDLEFVTPIIEIS